VFAFLDHGALLGALAAVPLYAVLQVLALMKLPGGWRYAAAMPVFFAIMLAAPAVDASRGAALPSERTLMLFSPAAILYLALIGLLAAGVTRLRQAQAAAHDDELAARPHSR
jgi:hypothetical protein